MEITKGASTRAVVRWRCVIWQTLHLGAGGALYIFMWLILARQWGVDLFGQFNFIFAYVAVVGVMFDFGQDMLVARIVAEGQPGIPRSALWIKTGLIGIGYWLFLLVGMQLDFPQAELMIFLGGVVLLSSTSMLNGILRGKDRLDVEGMIGLLQKCTFTGIGIAGVLWFEGGVLWVGFSYLAGHLLGFCCTAIVVYIRGWLHSYEWRTPKELLKETLPLWGVALAFILFGRIDLFLLGILMDERAIGLFSATLRLVDGGAVVATAYSIAAFPRLVASLGNTDGHFRDLMFRSLWILLGAGALAAGIVYFYAQEIIDILYGVQFAGSTVLLKTLVPILGLLFIAGLFGQALIAQSRQLSYMLVLVCSLVVALIIELALIPLFGTLGAVYGYWARAVVLVAGLTWLLLRRKKPHIMGKTFG